eukprot:365334-Chlamydomonas_euryale.AAC.11
MRVAAHVAVHVDGWRYKSGTAHGQTLVHVCQRARVDGWRYMCTATHEAWMAPRARRSACLLAGRT